MKTSTEIIALSLLLRVGAALAGGWVDETLKLAADLVADGDRRGAALEYRRLALDDAQSAYRGVFYWMAAHEYGKAGDYERASTMLDRAAALDPPSAAQRDLLRGENELAAGRPGAAALAYERVLEGVEDPDARRYSARRLAVARLRSGHVAAAREALVEHAGAEPELIETLDRYAGDRGRSLVAGGLLGLVPGLGYAYSGEYDNALRSLLLNGIFILGMVETAGNEDWGVFAAIGFFELTWYSGSVLGGIDAADRYNRDRLQACADGITGRAACAPEYFRLPLLSIQYQF